MQYQKGTIELDRIRTYRCPNSKCQDNIFQHMGTKISYVNVVTLEFICLSCRYQFIVTYEPTGVTEVRN